MRRRSDLVWTLVQSVVLIFVQDSILAAAESTNHQASSQLPVSSAGTDLNNQGVLEARAGRFEQGIALLRQAVAQAPQDAPIRHNLSGILTDWSKQLVQRDEVERAITILEEAVTSDPDNGQALARLGDLYYVTQDDFSKAIAVWKRAYGHVTTAQWQLISQRLSQAERDRAIEREFTGLETPHFRIRFEHPESTPQVARLGAILEQHYTRLADSTGTAPGNLTVIIYTSRDFQRIAGRRDWAFGLYDGRVRLRLDDLQALWAPQIIAHELAHAFLARGYGPRIPIWIHEGFAQAQEPSQALAPPQQAMLDDVKARTLWIPLKWLDHRFEQPSNLDDVERAYVEARWVVQTLLARYGASRFQAFLSKLSTKTPIDQAFDQTFAPLRWVRVEQGNMD